MSHDESTDEGAEAETDEGQNDGGEYLVAVEDLIRIPFSDADSKEEAEQLAVERINQSEVEIDSASVADQLPGV